MIWKLLTSALTGDILDRIEGITKAYFNKEISQTEWRTKLMEALLAAMTGAWENQRDVLIAEINSDSWLTRTWRPIAATTFAFVLVFYALILPMLVNWVGVPPLQTSDTLLEHLVSLLTIAFTGYVAGRSLEKIAEKFKGK